MSPTQSIEEYPFTSQYLELEDGLRMHYIDEGPRDAPVCVFVHGNPSWSFLWRHLITQLSDRFRCIAMDHIGMGLSDKPRDAAYPYRLDRRVADLGCLLDRLVPEGPVTLCVHDWGGMIGCSWAVDHPDRIERLVVTNTAAFGLPDGKTFPWQLHASRSPFGALLVRGFNGFCRYANKHCVRRRPLGPAAAAGLVAPYDSWANRRAVHRFVQDIPLRSNHPSWDRVQTTAKGLHRLQDKPMLICWGLGDFVFDADFLAEWRRRFPAAQVHEWPDGGHYVTEDYREEIGALVEDFLV